MLENMKFCKEATIRKATTDEYLENFNKIYNIPLVLEYKDNIIDLSAGLRDNVTCYEIGDNLYVLNRNQGLDYVVLECFDKETLFPTGDCFIENASNNYYHNRNLMKYNDKQLIKYLENYLSD